jgi:hypothetical protein
MQKAERKNKTLLLSDPHDQEHDQCNDKDDDKNSGVDTCAEDIADHLTAGEKKRL